MSNRTIRWGIIGAGGISSKFASDLKSVPNAELVAVAAQSADRARSFAERYDIPHAYGSYEELVSRDDIDIVYIGTLHPMHKDGVLLCLNAGKAVLCEKPFTMDASEAEVLIRTAREKKLFLMEAMWTRYLPTIVQTRKWIAEGAIGEVKSVTANFSFDIGFQPEHRLLNKKLGGGSLLDAGIYPVSFASMVFGQQPDKIMSTAYIGETGVDERFSALFEYSGNRTASLNGGVRLQMVNEAYIYGTEGYIRVPDFLWSRVAYLYRADGVRQTLHDDRKTHGYNYEAAEATRCLLEGRLESSIMPLDETLKIMQTLDAMRKQWGLEY